MCAMYVFLIYCYNICIVNKIKIEQYIRTMVIQDNYFVFHQLLVENCKRWLDMKKYYHKENRHLDCSVDKKKKKIFENDFLKSKNEINSVKFIDHLDNNDYDVLLSQNIVFLDLYDTSANNAVIECIARGTPLLINRHPATIEYLGEKYPFYFDSLKEANEKLNNISNKSNIKLFNKFTEKLYHKIDDNDKFFNIKLCITKKFIKNPNLFLNFNNSCWWQVRTVLLGNC